MTVILTRPAIHRGLGISPELLGRMSLFRPGDLSAMQNLYAIIGSGAEAPAPGPGAGAPSEASEECLCKSELVLAQLGGSDPVLLNQLAVLCTANPATMDTIIAEAGVSIEPCKPWYMRKTTWIAGGLVAAVGVAFVVLR